MYVITIEAGRVKQKLKFPFSLFAQCLWIIILSNKSNNPLEMGEKLLIFVRIWKSKPKHISYEVYNCLKGRREVYCFLIITQDDIIKTISEKEDIKITTVRKVFKSAEKLIFNYLSSTTPTDNTSIKILDGLSLECNYIPEKEIHTYDVIKCDARIWAKPKITRYYNRKLNGYFASKKNV